MTRRLPRLLVLAVALLAAPAAAQRLPTNVRPIHYALWFAPDLATAAFRGRVTIDIALAAPAATITLNAAELAFDDVVVTDGTGSQAARVTLDEKAETATLAVPRAIAKGPATIQITYAGILNDQLRGFYLSRANGRAYAVSQMEATDARRAFPSFDEPAFKATFDIALMVDAADTAISNGRVVSDVPGPEPGKHTVTFGRTPKMSTYLVALLVGDFACRAGTAGQTPVRVCATPDKLGLTAFALAAAEQQIGFFNDYFGLPYPYEKLDIVGIPDFAAGAMENAGAITFRERLLLADEATASVETLKAVASVISHELAHQWFGNLVTMKWWDDIWLNEGFATWAANKPLAAWKPEWRLNVTVATETQAALALDTLPSTRAIHTSVSTPAEINEVFDPIAYEKTAGVLAMVEAYVGADAFRRGVSSYLSKYANGNAAGEDFWMEMTRTTEKPVNRIMRSFVDQPGAPVLSARSRCVGDVTEITIRQQRFAALGATTEPTPQVWTLPVCIKTGAGPATCALVSEREQTLRAPGCGAAVLNADARGYYLTEYEPPAVIALGKRVPPLTAPERIGLLGDEWRMVLAGRHDIGTYLDLAGGFARDETPAVVRELADRLAYARGRIAGEEHRAALDRWLHDRFGPALGELGVGNGIGDSDDINSRRGSLLQLLADDPGVQQRARELVARYLDNPASLAPGLVASVLEVAASAGDASLYERFLARMTAARAAPEEYYRYFNALPSFREPELVRRTLALALGPDVRSQDTPVLLAALLGSPHAQEATWAFVREHWSEVTAKVGVFQGVPYVVTALGAFCSTERADQVTAFFKAHPAPEAARALRLAVESITSCAAVEARQSPALARWLATQPAAR